MNKDFEDIEYRHTGITNLYAGSDGNIYRISLNMRNGKYGGLKIKKLKGNPNKTSGGLLKLSLADKELLGNQPYVHRLVAMAFLEDPDQETNRVVLHINGDKQDNRPENLCWGKRAKKPRGYRKSDQVIDILTGECWPSVLDCANALGVPRRYVAECVRDWGSFTDSKGYTRLVKYFTTEALYEAMDPFRTDNK